MQTFLKESGISAVVVVFLVFVITSLIHAPWSNSARFALAILLFLIAMGVRRLIQWVKPKRKQGPDAGPKH
jgi:ABC-type transport system involved in cytochrome bd biosynthesis fused ATPase/permease subunit